MRVTLALLALFLGAVPAALATYQLGDTVDDFALPDLDGQPVHLADFQGHVIVINFFATWCPPCNEEAPLLQELYTEYREAGLTILGVDLLEDPALVAGWAQQKGLSYPIVLAANWDLFREFPMAGGFPYNAVIDPAGVLRYSQYGLNMDEITLLVEELLPEDAVAARPASWDAVRALYR